MNKKIQIIIFSIIVLLTPAIVFGYQIQFGDTLSQIAQQFNTTINDLMNKNIQIEDPNKIYVGDEIDIGEISFGSITPIAGSTYNLAGSGVNSSATSFTLQSFTIKQTGQKLSDSDLGDIFYLTLEPGNNTRQEIVSCNAVTQNSGGTATLSGCSRGLSPITPYTASSTLAFSHAGGSQVILSDPPQLFNEFAAKKNTEWITGTWGFSKVPTSSDVCTETTEFCNKAYIDNSVNQGAATSTEDVAGISEQATQNEMASSTPFDANNPHFISSEYATSTPSDISTGEDHFVVVTEDDLKINQGFLDLTEQYTWTGTHGFTGQVDLIGTNYTNYLGGSFNIGWSAATLGNATGTLNVLGDSFFTGDTVGSETIFLGTAGEAITAGNAVFATNTDGEIWKTDADVATTTLPFLGFAVNSASDGGQVWVQTTGNVGGFSGLATNSVYYLSGTPGGISTATATVEQIAGYAISSTELNIDKRADFGSMFIGSASTQPFAVPTTTREIICNINVSENSYGISGDIYLNKYKMTSTLGGTDSQGPVSYNTTCNWSTIDGFGGNVVCDTGFSSGVCYFYR